MDDVKIRYSYTVKVEDAPLAVYERFERLYADSDNDLNNSLGELIDFMKKHFDVSYHSPTDDQVCAGDVDELTQALDIMQERLQALQLNLEESKTIMLAYKQAKVGDYDDPAEESMPPKPDALEIVGELKNIADSMKRANDGS